MNDVKIQLAAFQKELGEVAKVLAAKHNLTLAKNFIKYDAYQWNASLKFNINGQEDALKQLEARLYSSDGDPKIGDVVNYRRTSYKVTGYNRNGTLLATRNVDGRSFKFKRNKVTFKYDYFDKVAVA